MACVPTVWRSPTHITVAVLIAVAHPVSVAFALTLVDAEQRHILTPLVPTGLAKTTRGALCHHGRVGDVVAKVEVGSPADKVAVVKFYFSGQDLSAGA